MIPTKLERFSAIFLVLYTVDDLMVAGTGRALWALPDRRVDGGLCPPSPPQMHSCKHIDALCSDLGNATRCMPYLSTLPRR